MTKLKGRRGERKTMRANAPRRASACAKPALYEPAEIDRPRAKGALGVSRVRWWKALRATLPPPEDGSAARARYRRFFLDNEYHGARILAKTLGLSLDRLCRSTRGAAFSRDFGVDVKGRPVVVFYEAAMLKWALGA